MPRLHSVKPGECIRAFERLGFMSHRQSGSHLTMLRGSATIQIPVHKGRDLNVGTLRSIIRQSGVSVKDFLDALDA
jgi:predicted RNA binding protein YcfA (HicA-like mRNA interferase family)